MVNIPGVHPAAVLVGVILVAVLVAGCTINVPSVPESTSTTHGATVNVTAPAGTAAQTTTAGPAASAATTIAGTTAAGTATTTGAPTAGTTAPVLAETAGATPSSTSIESTMAAPEKGGSTVATAGTVQTPVGPGGSTTAPTPTACPADLSGSPRSGPAPLTVTFTALNPCTVWQHMWDFGDGSEIQTVDGTIATVTHTYTSPGTYTVHVLDDDGRLEDGETKTNYITVTAPGVTATPTTCPADFTGSPRSGPAPLTVTFTALNPCTVWQHMWSYGDGTLFDGSDLQTVDGAIATVTHTYTSPGTYTVILIDDDGRLEDGESKTGYITVTGPGETGKAALVTGHPTIQQRNPGLILTTTPAVKTSLLVKSPTILQATPGPIFTTTPVQKIIMPSEIPIKLVTPQL